MKASDDKEEELATATVGQAKLCAEIASFPGPSFSFKSWTVGLVHTVCACAPITKNHGNLDISAVFDSVTL